MLKIGVIANEFFCPEYPPYGGFGFSASNFCRVFNRRPEWGIEAVALLPAYRGPGAAPLRLHDTRVIPSPVDLAPGQPVYRAYRERLTAERFGLLVAVDYYPDYYTRLIACAAPWLFWVRDPRPSSRWKKILSVRRSGRRSEYGDQPLSQYDRFGRLVLRSLLGHRRFAAAVQESWLWPRACEALPFLRLCRPLPLINPLPMPDPPAHRAPRPTALFVGRLVGVKRPWVFFELARRMPQADFWVLGEERPGAGLEADVQSARRLPNLRFWGALSGDDKRRLFEQAWVLVNTSVHEGMPQSVLEAFTYGLPVVTCEDFARHVPHAAVHTGEDPADFEAALSALWADPARGASLGRAARLWAQERYSEEVFLSQMAAVWKRLGLGSALFERAA